MPLLDAQGAPVRKTTDDQLILALNTLSQRNQSLQLQLMQLGLLVEFLIEKLGKTTLPDGSPVFSVEDSEFEEFSTRRYQEIQQEAKEFNRLMQESKTKNPVNLEE